MTNYRDTDTLTALTAEHFDAKATEANKAKVAEGRKILVSLIGEAAAKLVKVELSEPGYRFSSGLGVVYCTTITHDFGHYTRYSLHRPTRFARTFFANMNIGAERAVYILTGFKAAK